MRPTTSAALLTDLYQLTMLQAFWREGLQETAVFSLFVRTLPARRNYLLACGLAGALEDLRRLRFTADDRTYLDSLDRFEPGFLDWLGGFRFQGDVHAVPEGTPVFAGEPLLEVVAPLPQAQLVETLLLNRIHLQTVLASKAARVVAAAAGRPVLDFGLRRMHGADAALEGARALAIAGVAATSNVLAGRLHGLAVAGTMAHSYVQAHASEEEALRAFASLYPGAILLVDTYDTGAGVELVARLAGPGGEGLQVGGVRIDSGDLLAASRDARRRLDVAGLRDVEIVLSGGLDEEAMVRLLEAGAPVDGFGVGTHMGVSADAPFLDMVYKLTAYAGRDRVKRSPGKATLPGRKQVHRLEQGDQAVEDILARHGEEMPGRPLLRPVMAGGRVLPAGRETLEAIQRRVREETGRLPARVRGLAPAQPPYPVRLSPGLAAVGGPVRPT